MALDPATAFGVATGVVPLVDFSAGLTGRSAEIYHSGMGSTRENRDLEKSYAEFASTK